MVAGGACTRVTTATTIPVARPLLDEREAEAARRVILSGWVTQGPEVAGFEIAAVLPTQVVGAS